MRVDSINGNAASDGIRVPPLVAERGLPPPASSKGQKFDRTLLIVDTRALDRECFAQSLLAHGIGMNVVHTRSVEDLRRKTSDLPSFDVILLNIGGRQIPDGSVEEEIKKLNNEFHPAPVILLADTDELPHILQALEYGAGGFIPTSVGIQVCIEAIGLAMAGGIFVPASSVIALRQAGHLPETRKPLAEIFTPRQVEVAEALRRGKANKIIAFELNLRESTVKVHIRNIMRKLKATNRTEVAFRINDLAAGGRSSAHLSSRTGK